MCAKRQKYERLIESFTRLNRTQRGERDHSERKLWGVRGKKGWWSTLWRVVQIDKLEVTLHYWAFLTSSAIAKKPCPSRCISLGIEQGGSKFSWKLKAQTTESRSNQSFLIFIQVPSKLPQYPIFNRYCFFEKEILKHLRVIHELSIVFHRLREWGVQ